MMLVASGVEGGRRRILDGQLEGGIPVMVQCGARRNSTKTRSLGLVLLPWKGALRAKIR